VDGLGGAQALPDEVNVPLRSGYSARRLLLKRMQDIQDALKPDGIDGPVGIAVKIMPDLQNPAQAFERFPVNG
jgi:hypothetical protein